MVIGQQVESEECAGADGQDSLAAGARTKAVVLATRQEQQEGQGVQAAEDRRGRRRHARIAKEDARERDAAGTEHGRQARPTGELRERVDYSDRAPPRARPGSITRPAERS